MEMMKVKRLYSRYAQLMCYNKHMKRMLIVIFLLQLVFLVFSVSQVWAVSPSAKEVVTTFVKAAREGNYGTACALILRLDKSTQKDCIAAFSSGNVNYGIPYDKFTINPETEKINKSGNIVFVGKLGTDKITLVLKKTKGKWLIVKAQ